MSRIKLIIILGCLFISTQVFATRYFSCPADIEFDGSKITPPREPDGTHLDWQSYPSTSNMPAGTYKFSYATGIVWLNLPRQTECVYTAQGGYPEVPPHITLIGPDATPDGKNWKKMPGYGERLVCIPGDCSFKIGF